MRLLRLLELLYNVDKTSIPYVVQRLRADICRDLLITCRHCKDHIGMEAPSGEEVRQYNFLVSIEGAILESNYVVD